MTIVYHDIIGSTDNTWKVGLDVSVDGTNKMKINIALGTVTINNVTYTLASGTSIIFESNTEYDKLIWIYLLTDDTLYVEEVIDDGFQECLSRDDVALILAEFIISANQTDLDLEDIHIVRTVT